MLSTADGCQRDASSNLDRSELAGVITDPAFGAGILVNNVGFILFTGDGILRTLSSANTTSVSFTDAQIRIDRVNV